MPSSFSFARLQAMKNLVTGSISTCSQGAITSSLRIFWFLPASTLKLYQPATWGTPQTSLRLSGTTCCTTKTIARSSCQQVKRLTLRWSRPSLSSSKHCLCKRNSTGCLNAMKWSAFANMPIRRQQWSFARRSTATKTAFTCTVQDVRLRHGTNGIALMTITMTNTATSITTIDHNCNVLPLSLEDLLN